MCLHQDVYTVMTDVWWHCSQEGRHASPDHSTTPVGNTLRSHSCPELFSHCSLSSIHSCHPFTPHFMALTKERFQSLSGEHTMAPTFIFLKQNRPIHGIAIWMGKWQLGDKLKDPPFILSYLAHPETAFCSFYFKKQSYTANWGLCRFACRM